MVVYFSGTGNSRYCAQLLADRLGDELLDAFQYIRHGIAAELICGKPWVFVSPTYAWQLPRVFAEFIRSANFEGSDDAWFVMTCGSEIGAPEKQNRKLCQQKGLNYRGTVQITMPENYIAVFGAPEQAEGLRIVAAARPVLEQSARQIAAGESFAPVRAGTVDRIKSGIVNRVFYPLIVSAKDFTVADSCISCGKCEEVCPTGCVKLQNGRPVWGEGCTHCMACISKCSVTAIEYGKVSQGKPRWNCPEYRGE